LILRRQNGLLSRASKVSHAEREGRRARRLTKLRFWRNCAVASTASGGTESLVKHYLGYEWDEALNNGFSPSGLIRLSLTTLAVNTLLQDFGHVEGPGIATHSLTLYRHPSGAIVFGAGTVMWSWGLDPNHDPDPNDKAQTPVDPNVKQAMVNLLADMGALPGSLSALVPGVVSSDHTAPVSAISSPANGASFPQNQTVAISGTCSDTAPGIVAGVEASTDNGVTWHPVSTTTFNASSGSITGWTYNWAPTLTGTYKLLSRAIDDSLNIGAASAAVSVTATASAGVSLFSGATPLTISVNDPNSVELGLKFQSSHAGSITAIRFYKGPTNVGTHTAHLWTSTGTLLASATFSGESSSGWQQVALSPAVQIAANTLYVVSYHTAGNYSADNDYFSTNAHTVGPLTAPAGANGVYAYGAGTVFPSNTFSGSNYYVDVVFIPGTGRSPQPPVANNDSGFAATENTALSIPASALLANDTDPGGLAISLASVTAGSGGTVVLSGTNVIFTPTTGYTGPASHLQN
jgi:hypothetical protein